MTYQDSIKRLSSDFLAESLFFLHAWHYSFPKEHPDGEPYKFSEWYEQKQELSLDAPKEGAIWFYKDLAERMAKKNKVFPDDDIKNMAFVHLYAELMYGGEFEIDVLQKKDFRPLGAISQRYFCLSILYEHFEDTIAFIEKHAPDENPYYALESIRETLSKSGNRAIGYWYANSQEVRGFVDKWKRQIQATNKGGIERAKDLKLKRIHWQPRADELWNKNQDFSYRSVAEIIARETGDKAETIRKHIKKP